MTPHLRPRPPPSFVFRMAGGEVFQIETEDSRNGLTRRHSFASSISQLHSATAEKTGCWPDVLTRVARPFRAPSAGLALMSAVGLRV